MSGRWEVYQPHKSYTVQLYPLYLPEKQSHWQNFPSSDWSCWGDTGGAGVSVSLYFGWQRKSIMSLGRVENGYRGTFFFHGARNALCHVPVASPLSVPCIYPPVLGLSRGKKTTRFEPLWPGGPDKFSDYHPVTQKASTHGGLLLFIWCFLFLITCFRKGRVSHAFISISDCGLSPKKAGTTTVPPYLPSHQKWLPPLC